MNFGKVKSDISHHISKIGTFRALSNVLAILSSKDI